MNSVLVKICGLTRATDIDSAITAGAGALGFVMAPSPRRLQPADVRRLTAVIPAGIMRVGLFMDQPRTEIQAVLEQVEFDLLQFHGSEPDDFCASFGRPFLKAIAMGSAGAEYEPQALAGLYPNASGLLLDSHAPGGRGGTGQAFDWSRSLRTDKPLWLAGGLTPENVAAAIARLQPFAVDVSSGVETSPGIKDPVRMRKFIENARNA